MISRALTAVRVCTPVCVWHAVSPNVNREQASKQLRKFYRLRLKQSVMYLSTLFAERIKRKATAIPKKYRVRRRLHGRRRPLPTHVAHDVCDTLEQTASGTGVGIRIGRWISRGDEGVASGLRFMPYHLLQADRRKEALSVMLDLQYVEVSAGVVLAAGSTAGAKYAVCRAPTTGGLRLVHTVTTTPSCPCRPWRRQATCTSSSIACAT